MNGHEFLGIVLATYNPNPAFFSTQIESIKNQKWAHWCCHIVDDASSAQSQKLISQVIDNNPHFICHFHDSNLGVYHNFERGLNYLKTDTRITAILFSDQDDIWLETKLSTLIKKLRAEGAVLVHSDLALIDEANHTLHSSVWNYENRHPEKVGDPQLLLLRNAFTGCTLLFDRSLLEDILPFPPQGKPIGWYHDCWVALIALQKGKIVHLRQSLVQYRQHGTNTIGAQQGTGSIRKEIALWLAKKGRLTLKSYRIHRDLSNAFYQRFYPDANLAKINSFSEQRLDFGLSILKLGIRSVLIGYGSQGITLRLVINKFIFDCLKIKRWLSGKS